MDPEAVINLFDSYWFNHEILTEDPSVSCVKTGEPELKFSSLRSILVRSQSDDIGSSFNYGPFSPTTVLKPLVPSRKKDYAIQKQEQEQEQVAEVVQESDQTPKILDQSNLDHIEQREMKKKKSKKRRHGSSKSLSDLEFEELKGFMDMGFVFSEQDKDSSLIKILPGLQRLGEDDGDDDDGGGGGGDGGGGGGGDGGGGGGDGGGRRPYLSEAWDEMDGKLKKKEDKKVPPVVMKWEIPAVGDEVDMKDNLKLWAHTVASIVR